MSKGLYSNLPCDSRITIAFFIIEQLGALGKLFDSGELKAFRKAELPMEKVDHASRLACWLSAS